jgi:hypothetical protein
MNKLEFLTKFNTIEKLQNLYNTLTDEAIASKYGLTHSVIREIKKDNNIIRIRPKQYKVTKAKNNLIALSKNITKDKLYKYYESENHSWKECLVHFNISHAQLTSLFKLYNINKSSIKSKQLREQTKLTKYNNPRYTNEAKREQTNIKKYGVKSQWQRQQYIRQKCFDKYGVYYPAQLSSITNKITNSTDYTALINKRNATCLKKYGTVNVNQLENIKQKIKEGVQHTFQDKYGIDNYWDSPDAKRSNGSKNSKANIDFASLLDNNNIKYEREFSLENKWFDFKIDNILVEINPTATHNINWSPWNKDKGIDINYHLNKMKLANKNKFRCIQIWDWDDKNKIVQLLKKRDVFYARKCIIKEVDLKEAIEFINLYHLQGYARDKVRIGLYYNNKLISIMTFNKPRYNKNYEWELIRYCSSSYIVGGAEKLFNYFIKTYSPLSIVSYCDLSKFEGTTYRKLNFTLARTSAPSIHWYNLKTKEHYTDNLLRQQGFSRLILKNNNQELITNDNNSLMLMNGFVQIPDCGQETWVWVNNL